MGEYEDLVDQASQGDTDAAETLKTKYGSTKLREEAAKGAAVAKAYEESLPLARRGAFAQAAEALDDSLRQMVRLEDIGEVPPQEITAELLKSKAQSNLNAANERKLTSAKESGFETVEEYDAALQTLKEQQNTRQRQLEAVGAATASGSGGTPVPEGTQTPFEAGKAAFDAAKNTGASDDVAHGEFVHQLLAAQAPMELEG